MHNRCKANGVQRCLTSSIMHHDVQKGASRCKQSSCFWHGHLKGSPGTSLLGAPLPIDPVVQQTKRSPHTANPVVHGPCSVITRMSSHLCCFHEHTSKRLCNAATCGRLEDIQTEDARKAQMSKRPVSAQQVPKQLLLAACVISANIFF